MVVFFRTVQIPIKPVTVSMNGGSTGSRFSQVDHSTLISPSDDVTMTSRIDNVMAYLSVTIICNSVGKLIW